MYIRIISTSAQFLNVERFTRKLKFNCFVTGLESPRRDFLWCRETYTKQQNT